MRHKEIKKKTNEGLGDLAARAEMDHEVQMARSDLYKIAKYSIKLHEMLKGVSEAEGMQGWQQAKITKAADYMSSVFHSLDYDMKFAEGKVAEAKKTSYKDGLSAMLETKTDKGNTCEDCGKPSYSTLDLSEEELDEVAGPDKCWKGYKRAGTQAGTGKNAGKRVNKCVKA